MNEIISILNNVIFVYIAKGKESIYIDAVKIKDNDVIYYKEEIGIYNKWKKEEFVKFIDKMPMIIEDVLEFNNITMEYFKDIKFITLDFKEFAAILEPWRKDYGLKSILLELTNLVVDDDEFIDDNATYLLYGVNTLLCRMWYMEDIKYHSDLYKELRITSIGNESWNWTDYLLRPLLFTYEKYSYVILTGENSRRKELKKVDIKYDEYEKLLRKDEIWNNGSDINYVHRIEQEKMAEKIKNNIIGNKRIFIEAPTGSGKTFAYVIIVAILSYLNGDKKHFEDGNFIISTDTKELQNQLIEKDIPNILRKLNLQDRVKYGAMKGKGNYVCVERLDKCEKFIEDKRGYLAYAFLKRLAESGEYGDIENISYYAYEHFDIENYKTEVTCDSEKCNLEKCRKKCYLKNRYNELSSENITVVNHSLLASWPYYEKRAITHLIIDEAHNLMEKGYDYFSEEFNSYEFLNLIKETYEGKPSMIFLLNRLNGLYNFKEQIDVSLIKNKCNEIEFNLLNLINEFKRCDLTNGEYDFNEEFYNAEDKYKDVLESMKEPISNLKISIYGLYKVIYTYVNNIVYDEKDSGNEYKTLSNYLLKLKTNFDILDSFLTFDRNYAKIINIDKNFNYFIIKNTPLNIGELINEKILAEVKSTVFISATLRINNSFNTIKDILGQEEADDYLINPVFDLKRRTKVFIPKDIGSYRDEDKYIQNTAEFILNLGEKLNGHILVLFNNNSRRDKVKNAMELLNKDKGIEIHTSKKAISILKDKERKAIILGTKGFFEGIDLPGDSLSCVIFDKIPNINPKEPLFKAMKNYKKIYYKKYNYPKMCIKLKQGYGRLIRSVYDYGYFIILDGGTNEETIFNIERDLNGPRIDKKNRKEILNMVEKDYVHWKKENLRLIIKGVGEENIDNKFNELSGRCNSFWEYIGKEGDGRYIFNNIQYRIIANFFKGIK